jgi:hypothetical protein
MDLSDTPHLGYDWAGSSEASTKPPSVSNATPAFGCTSTTLRPHWAGRRNRAPSRVVAECRQAPDGIAPQYLLGMHHRRLGGTVVWAFFYFFAGAAGGNAAPTNGGDAARSAKKIDALVYQFTGPLCPAAPRHGRCPEFVAQNNTHSYCQVAASLPLMTAPSRYHVSVARQAIAQSLLHQAV